MLCLSAKSQQLDLQLVPHIYTGGNHISCNGLSNGSIAAFITGGQAPYQLLWNTSATTTNISNLAAGTYTLLVTDAANDTISRSIVLHQPELLGFQASSPTYNGYHTSAYQQNNAAIYISPTGGVSPYRILWHDGDTTFNRTGLSAQGFSFVITDAAGCTTSGSKNLNAPTALTGQVNLIAHATCYETPTGRAFVQAQGGVPPYTFIWKNGEEGDTAYHLAAGMQGVDIIDANETKVRLYIEIEEPEPFGVRAKAFRYQNGFNTSCASCANGKITPLITGGTAPYTAQWLYNDEPFSESINIENLEPGTYHLDMIDAQGCRGKASVELFPAPRDDWGMQGNEGSDPENDFMGTSDSTAMLFRTNNQPVLRLGADGTVEVMQNFKLNYGAEGFVTQDEEGNIKGETFEEVMAKFGEGLREEIYAEKQCNQDPNSQQSPQWVSKPSIMYIKCPDNSRVGINTNTPQANLHVIGNALVTGSSSSNSAIIGYPSDEEITSNSTTHVKASSTSPNVSKNAITIEHTANATDAYSILNKVNQNTTKAIAVEQTADGNKETFVVYGDGTTVIGADGGNDAVLNVSAVDKNSIVIKHEETNAEPAYSVAMQIDVNKIQTKAITITKDNEQEVVIYGDGTAYFGKGATLTAGAQLTKLAVDGKFGARSMIVLDFNQPFPDYVFDETYCIDDIETIFNWIRKYKHLPGVISEEEVKADGYLDMSKLQIQMLEKIEELYIQLYRLQLELNELKNK